MALEPAGPDVQLDTLFKQFLADVFGFASVPDVAPYPFDLRRYQEEHGGRLLGASRAWLSLTKADGERRTTAQQPDWLGHELAGAQAELDRVGLSGFVQDRFTIAYQPEKLKRIDRTCIYVKLNHGFWEDLYALFVRDHRRDKPRRLSLDISREGTVESGFLAALTWLLGNFASISDRTCSFEGVSFGTSFFNGAGPHSEFMAHQHTWSELRLAVARAASVGAAAFFGKLFPDCHMSLDDGCFPKFGYSQGNLHDVLDAQANASDQIVFAVPVHLRGIRLNTAHASAQECMHLSRHLVHESWIASLRAASAHILKKLVTGRRLLVIAQFGPFTVLLGLYLAYAVRALGLHKGCLAYFDLGQVPDLANPSQSGPWLKNYTHVKNDGLFQIAS